MVNALKISSNKSEGRVINCIKIFQGKCSHMSIDCIPKIKYRQKPWLYCILFWGSCICDSGIWPIFNFKLLKRGCLCTVAMIRIIIWNFTREMEIKMHVWWNNVCANIHSFWIWYLLHVPKVLGQGNEASRGYSDCYQYHKVWMLVPMAGITCTSVKGPLMLKGTYRFWHIVKCHLFQGPSVPLLCVWCNAVVIIPLSQLFWNVEQYNLLL